MTANKRIFLNIVATYGRSLFALLCGLFTARWTLQSLGEVDYGLYGVVGGLTAFVTFFNGVMSTGIGRFYAISVGKATNDEIAGLNECRKIFTTAVILHTILPLVLLAIGYPIGEWAVRHFLVIPPDRVSACVVVWRLTALSCFVGMISVPFYAMYTAKQEIAELTVYGFVTTILNVGFLCYMINVQRDWLIPFASWMAGLSIVPTLIIIIRSFFKYRECRIEKKYLRCWRQIVEIAKYAIWFAIGNAAALLKNQGIAVLINKFWGARVNTANALGMSVISQCASLSSSLTGAFYPVIISAYGAGDMEKVKKFAYRVSRVATLSVLIFILPLLIEIDFVLRLWLKNVPEYLSGICVCGFLGVVMDKTSFGYAIAAHACKKIAKYQFFVGGVNLLTLPVAIVIAWLGGNVYSVVGCTVLTSVLVAGVRVVLSTQMLPLSAMYWVKHILLPIAWVSGASLLPGVLSQCLLQPSFWRLVISTGLIEIVFLSLSWILVLDQEERTYVLAFLRKRLRRNHG